MKIDIFKGKHKIQVVHNWQTNFGRFDAMSDDSLYWAIVALLSGTDHLCHLMSLYDKQSIAGVRAYSLTRILSPVTYHQQVYMLLHVEPTIVNSGRYRHLVYPRGEKRFVTLD